MNKNLKYCLFSLRLILALLVSGLAVRTIARAQEANKKGTSPYSPLSSSGSTTQSSGIDIGEAAVRDGQIITRVLARGGPLHGANGLYFGPDGYLYIASVFGGGITAMDPDSGHIVRQIGLQDGLDGPDDLTF